MLGSFGHHGVGLLLEGSAAGTRGLFDGPRGRGLGTGTHVHLFHSRHLHGLVSTPAWGQQGRGSRQCGSPRPAVPSCKLHWTEGTGRIRIVHSNSCDQTKAGLQTSRILDSTTVGQDYLMGKFKFLKSTRRQIKQELPHWCSWASQKPSW